jgi:hypothetical protein
MRSAKRIEILSLLLLTSFLVMASTITVSDLSTASGPSYGIYNDGEIYI